MATVKKVKKAAKGDWIAPVAAGIGGLGLGLLLGKGRNKGKTFSEDYYNNKKAPGSSIEQSLKKGGKIKKAKKIGPGPYNPQKAVAYVGKGVLRNGDTIPSIKGAITPVPNGPLIKKKGPFKGSTLKKGGTIKKAQLGDTVKSAAVVMKNGGKSPAWQRKEGKNPSGGLNAKGRASYNRANPGKPGLKAPQPEGGPRKKSFCARMSGMKKKLTSSKTANDPNSRINKSLRKWKC